MKFSNKMEQVTTKAWYRSLSGILSLGLLIIVAGCSKDKCKDVSCLNGGKCVDGSCNCVNGYTGDRCQNAPDKCQNVSCLNGGTCVDGSCNCVNGYTGDRCQNPPNVTPVASFSVSNNNCTAPCTVTFNDQSLYATTYAWEFGDGGTSTQKSPSHTYTNPGSYTVKLTVYSSSGRSHSTTQTVTIKPPSNQITKMRITKVTVENFPPKDGSSDWDSPITGTPPPDIYVEVSSDGSVMFSTRSNRFDNVTQADLPISWNITNSNVITALAAKVEVGLYDYDADGDDFMGGYYFYPVEEVSAAPKTIDLVNSASNIRIKLDVSWE